MKSENMTNSEDTSISDSLSTTSSVTSSKLNDLNASQSTNHRKSFSSSYGQDDRSPPTISLPFNVINGEKVVHVCQTTEGSLTLTNYRLFLQARDTNYNIPLGLIDQVECREIFFLHINCKDARYIRSTFPNNETATDVCKKIQQAVSSKPIEDYFAFTFYERLESDLSEDIKQQLGFEILAFPTPKERFDAEIKRMEFNVENPWRVSDENKDYELCSSYPTHIIVPNSMDKKKLEQVACFRSARRFPAIVWRHRGNGAVICRCSQPEVGWFGWRSAEDEELVQNIIQACAFDNSPNSTGEAQTTQSMESLSPSNSVQNLPQANGVQSMEVVAESPNLKKLLILDARSYTTAVANRARGGGCECLEYYPNCEIQFMNLANIHSIRKSFINLRQLCALPSDQANWYSQLESCKWLQHMSGLMKASLTVVTAIENGRPVMVHCSDGWDRTPQIVSLAEILLDPYYRSLEGFQVMVEREWFDFGHKFGDRCGQGVGSDDGNERCPVFLQWLDCLHQLIRQFPTAFEFNLSFLLKLVQHTYSNLFGTFLCNSAKERQEHEITKRTYSVWKFLRAEANSDKFRSSLYTNCDKVLWPSCEVRDLVLWSQVYLGYENPPPLLTEAINPSQESSPAPSVAADGEMTERLASCRDTLKPARSYENLASQSHIKGLQRKLSDSSLGDSFYGTQELEEEAHPVTKENLVEVAGNTSPVRSPSSAEFIIGASREDESENEEDTEPNSEGPSESTVISAYKVNLKSIESSTDTLVAENGILLEGGKGSMGADLNKTELYSPVSNRRTLESKPCPTINNLERKTKGFVAQPHRNCSEIPETTFEHMDGHHHYLAKTISHEESNGADKEKVVNCDTMEEYGPGFVRNGNHCEICANSKKIVGDFRENGNFPCANLNGISQALVSTSTSTSSGIGPSNSESKYSSYNTPIHSRTPSTGVPATPCCEDVGGIANLSCSGKQERYNIDIGGRPSFDVDGLTSYHDEVQTRVNGIASAYRSRIDTLEKELHVTKLALMYQISHRCGHRPVDRPDDIVSNADSACSGEHHSVGHESHASDLSWEAIDENDTMPTRWVPDYAAKECMNCDHPFWFASRKHHCRSCGKIFCADCSEKYIPLPNEQIFQPVRVCKTCFAKHTQQVNNAGAADPNASAPTINGISSASAPHRTTAAQNGRPELSKNYVPCNTSSDNSQSQHYTASNNFPTTHAKVKKPMKGNEAEVYRNGH